MSSVSKNDNQSLKYYSFVVIGFCAAFLFYKYILQVYPSLLTNEMMRDFHLDGLGLGNLTAVFYYTYMITQLFVGVLLDRFSIRCLSSLAILACGIALALFSQTHTLLMAAIARGLMGIGVAFATVTYMKLAAIWVPDKYYAFAGGLLATAAMAGAVFGEAPLSYLINAFGWRECLLLIGLAGLGLSFCFFYFIKDPTHKEVNRQISFKDLISVFKNKQNWLLTMYSGLAFSPLAIFGGLWGNPFLREAYHVGTTEAAFLISLAFIGLGLGSPLLGLLSDFLGKRKSVMITSTLVSVLALVCTIYCNTMPIWLLSMMLFTFGFGLGAFMLVFTIGKEINPLALTATVAAMINASDAFLDALTEPNIGKILDYFWDGKIVNGVHYFSVSGYQKAFLVLPLYLAIAMVILLFIKESNALTSHADQRRL